MKYIGHKPSVANATYPRGRTIDEVLTADHHGTLEQLLKKDDGPQTPVDSRSSLGSSTGDKKEADCETVTEVGLLQSIGSFIAHNKATTSIVVGLATGMIANSVLRDSEPNFLGRFSWCEQDS